MFFRTESVTETAKPGASSAPTGGSSNLRGESARAAMAPGTLIGERYQVVGVIGIGSRSTVYEAENTWTGRRVAVKVLRSEAAGDAEAVRCFQLEARLSASITHANVIDTLDMGEDAESGALYIVQRLLRGSDLRAHLRQTTRLTARSALAIIAPVLGALQAVHARGVVHRDVKPENIFIGRDARGRLEPTLLDFGAARVVGDAEAQRGRAARAGTPRYMSPEQCRGEGDVDARADVWAVGAVLYEMLAGRAAFDGDDAHDVMRQIREGAAAPLESIVDVPRALADVVRSAIEPDRARRVASAGAFLDAVGRSRRRRARAS
jgi:eukaryotic-like serine/threonine-protein kinase